MTPGQGGDAGDGEVAATESSLEALAGRLSEIADLEIRRDATAGEFCTYRVGGPFAVMATVGTSEALAALASTMSSTSVPALSLGRGSNLLVADDGFDGVAIVLGEGFASVEISETTVRAGAAALLPVVARASVAAGLTGFEWAVGVPGSIGGAVRMNAGGHGSDMAASLSSVEVADLHLGGLFVREVGSLELGYRHSNLKPWEIVASATLDLEPGSPDEGADLMSEIVHWRREHQPGGANAGSVFTNPEGSSAGALIDAAGGKGRRVGSAEVSAKHANFIQVDPDGSADDVLALMIEIVDLVEAVHGIRLTAETRLVGFDPAEVARVQPIDRPDGDTGEAR